MKHGCIGDTFEQQALIGPRVWGWPACIHMHDGLTLTVLPSLAPCSFFMVASNDRYGSYRAAMRSAAVGGKGKALAAMHVWKAVTAELK